MMYICLIGLFLAAFQATCDGAPERLVPALKLPADVLQEEKLVEKRALCTDDQKDKNAGCPIWQSLGYCNEASIYHQFMQTNCYASCGNCKLPPTPVPQVDEHACLKAHNDKRALHRDTEPLTWSDTLAQNAKEWADKLINGESGHDPNNSNEGENIYWSSSSTVSSCADAVENWYGEIKDYDYDHPGFHHTTGHFTQVVWKETKQVGAALAKKVNSQGYTETYVVARYFPPGNYRGEFANNVMPKK